MIQGKFLQTLIAGIAATVIGGLIVYWITEKEQVQLTDIPQLSAPEPAPVPKIIDNMSGKWNLATTVSYSKGPPECICGPNCSNSLLGKSSTRSFHVSHSKNRLNSRIAHNVTLEGSIQGNSAKLLVVGQFDQCPDYVEFQGTVVNKEIRGSFIGHDCNNICQWGGQFRIRIEPVGKL